MPDNFVSTTRNLIGGATGVFLITPDDVTDLDIYTRAISWAGAGDLEVILIDTDPAAPVVIPSGALAIGVMHHLRVRRVLATNTTATGIVGYY